MESELQHEPTTDPSADTRSEFGDETDTAIENESVVAVANEAVNDAEPESDATADTTAETTDASQPFVGRWNRLISSTNWEKGRIIFDWRANLQQSGAQVAAYSDETWVRCVGGVTAPHVGRLRRVYEKFGADHETYPGLYWSHFLAAIDWDDAPLWLEGAVRSGWSIAQMRQQRWEANGSLPQDEPQAADIIDADADEDVVMPAQGGGSEGRFDKEPDGVSAGPVSEGPDFGDETEFDGSRPAGANASGEDDADHLEGGEGAAAALVQPFAGLPELPGDMSEAMEMFKLSIIRHKATGWTEVAPEAVVKTLDALKLLVAARSE